MFLKTFFITTGLWLGRITFTMTALWGLGFCAFLAYVRSLSTACPSVVTGGIVVFTGDTGRIKVGLSLFDSQKKQPLLSLSGVGALHNVPMHPRIHYDGANNTRENIYLTKQWIEKNALCSLRLVTSDYHMPRCLLLAKRYWPPHILILPHPVKHKGMRFLRNSFVEYNKYLLSLTGLHRT